MIPTQELFTSFNYFEFLYNNAVENNFILLNDEGIVMSCNAAFTNCFGYEPKDIIGKYFSIFFTEEDQTLQKPERELRQVMDRGQSFDNNYLVSKDKSITWVSGESVLVKNLDGEKHLLKIIQNIHGQKTSEIALKTLNDLNENILSSIDDVVLVLDEHMNITKANSAFSKLFRRQPDVAMMNFATLIKPYDVFGELYTNIQNAINFKRKFLNVPIELDTRDGEKRIFDVNCTNMEQVAGKSNVLLVIHDITVHKQVEREREDVIGFVAHELRNPLANLVLCNEIMMDALKENNLEEIHDLLQRSKNNVSRLNKMISELYDATKANSGNLKLDITAFNFGEMIKEAIDTVAVLQPSYNIIVKGTGNIEVSGDRYRLIQVVTNYLGNGIKYSNGKNDVVLTIQQNEKTLTVSVRDEGLGISATQLPYIFDRFFRAENTKNLEGIGLGLYLCRQIIHAHNGRVWAESEEGKGSTFYFSVPL